MPYDRLLTEYEGKFFGTKQIQEIEQFIQKLQPKWDKISNSVCRALEKIIRNKWQDKKIKCYVVKYCKYNGISHPLTIKINADFDFIYSTLIHELTHILVFYRCNSEKYRKILQELKRQFPNEEPRIIRHIYINFIHLQVLKKLFSQDFVNKILKMKPKYRKIGKAWRIVLEEEESLGKLFKIKIQNI